MDIKILDVRLSYGKNTKMSFPNVKGFSVRNLKYMKTFYREYKEEHEFVQLVAQLPWKHNITLIEKKDKKIWK